MAVQIVQQATSATGNSTAAQTVTLPLGASTPGNVLLVRVNTYNLVTVSLNDSANTYTQIGGYVVSGSNKLSMWYVANAAAATKLTVTPSASAYVTFTIEEISGLQASPFNASSSNTGTSTAISTGTNNINSSGDAIFVVANAGAQTIFQPQTNNNFSYICAYASYANIVCSDLLNAAVSQNVTFTVGNSSAFAALGASFKATAAASSGASAGRNLVGGGLAV
jgi:hypothetical protein